MSLKDMIIKVADYQMPTANDEKYQEGIDKLAAFVLEGMFAEEENEEALSKQAEEAMEKLSEEDKAVIREIVATGEGMARGEVIGKEAGYIEGANDMFSLAYNTLKNIAGDEFAGKFAAEVMSDAGISQEDIDSQQEVEQVREHIVDSAVNQIIQAANIDPRELSDEQKEEIINIAEKAGDIGIQQLMQDGEGEPSPKEDK